MKTQIKRKNSTTLPSSVNSGEPIFGRSTIGSGSGNEFDTLYIGGLESSNPTWKKVSMAEFTPAYVEQGNSDVNFSMGMYRFWFGSQDSYDSLSPKDPDTFYFITE